jgi:phage-related protein
LFPNREIFIFAPKNYNKAMKQIFEVEILPKAVEFLENLDEKTREKIYYNIRKSQFVRDNELFKKLNNLIWEFRTLYNNQTYRLFAFWNNPDGQNVLVIATHGIIKKTQKTPPKEIEKAEEIRKQYINNKK